MYDKNYPFDRQPNANDNHTEAVDQSDDNKKENETAEELSVVSPQNSKDSKSTQIGKIIYTCNYVWTTMYYLFM